MENQQTPQTSTPISPEITSPANQTLPPSNLTLSIVGLIFSFIPIASVAGFVICIVTLIDSRKNNNRTIKSLSIIGLIVSILVSILSIVAIPMVSKQIRDYYSSSSYERHVDVSEMKPTLIDDKISAPCFTAKLPENYTMSPKNKNCYVRLDNNRGTGQILLSIIVRAQTGEINMKLLKDTYSSYSGAIISMEETTVGGSPALKVVTSMDANFGAPSTIYIVLDDSGKYSYNGKKITSYMISSPSYLKTINQDESDIDIFVKSFQIK